jgi:hypothetical protein
MAELSWRTLLQVAGTAVLVTRVLDATDTNPQENNTKTILDSWIIGPVLKMVGAFEQSVKQHPLITMATPDLYRPSGGAR